MNGSFLRDRATPRGKTRHRSRPLSFERLEERRLLTAYNLLVSTYDDTAGSSVVQYSEATGLQVAGGAYTGNHGLGEATGLAVASDGSYYVSNLASGGANGGQVLHYSKSGLFLNVLGANDANPAPVVAPGTLAFGPNGNLYVSDLYSNDMLPGRIMQFDVNSATQQYQAAKTLWLPAGFTPGGYTFAPDSTHDLIVGNLNDQSILRFHSDGTTTTLVPPGSGYNPLAILALSNGNLLIADSDLSSPPDPDHHHQIALYDATTGMTNQFINLTTPTGAGGVLPQPTSLLLDTDGNLLVGLSPDHNGNGAVLKFNINTGALMSTLASGIGTPSGLALAPVLPEDLLAGTYDSTVGESVIRYNTSSQLIVGGAVTGDHGLGETTGVAVASDGSYYVSNLLSGGMYGGQVLHFNSAGVFLDVLGAGDAVHAPLAAPGTLAFGPDGNLYVADLYSDAIFQFDVSSSTQQYQQAKTLKLPGGFSPDGFTFAPDTTHDLIVGNLNDQSIVRFHSGGTTTTLVPPGSGYNSLAILALSNGNLLIADSDLSFPPDPAHHHQIALYDASTGMTSQFISLTTPTGAGGVLPQPTSLLLDTDGNLLVGLSPDHNGDGAVEKFDITTGNLLSTVVSSIGSPAGLALAPQDMTIVVSGRTLVVTSAAALPNGMSLMVGPNVLTAFGSAAPTASATIVTRSVSEATVAGADLLDSPTSGPTAPAVVPTRAATPADLRRPARVSVTGNYNGSDGQAGKRPLAAGYMSLWGPGSVPWDGEDPSDSGRLAAFDAVMAEYSIASASGRGLG